MKKEENGKKWKAITVIKLIFYVKAPQLIRFVFLVPGLIVARTVSPL